MSRTNAASSLPTEKGTPVPSISTHTSMKWMWHRPYKLIILAENGSRIFPLNKYTRRIKGHLETVLLPGTMYLVRKLSDFNPNQETYLVRFKSAPYIAFTRNDPIYTRSVVRMDSTNYQVAFGETRENVLHILQKYVKTKADEPIKIITPSGLEELRKRPRANNKSIV